MDDYSISRSAIVQPVPVEKPSPSREGFQRKKSIPGKKRERESSAESDVRDKPSEDKEGPEKNEGTLVDVLV